MRIHLGFFLLLAALSGCGSQISKSDLGIVVFEVPKVAGAEEPYQMPELGPPLEPSDDDHGRHGPF
jgi:hypothetical protein